MIKFRSQGTISLEKSYPGYDISGEIVPIQFGYDFSWVRFLLGTISPDTEEIGLSYFTCVFRVTRPFTCHDGTVIFDPVTLTLTLAAI